MIDYEMTRSLADVDAMIGIGGVTHDALVFLVEGIHGPPGERDQPSQVARMGGQVGVPPGTSRRDVLLARPDAVPGGGPKIGVLSDLLGPFEHILGNIGLREIGHGITARFEQQENPFAIGDPASAKAHAHAAAQRLYIQKAFIQRFRNEEPADCSRRKRALLPGQSQLISPCSTPSADG